MCKEKSQNDLFEWKSKSFWIYEKKILSDTEFAKIFYDKDESFICEIVKEENLPGDF